MELSSSWTVWKRRRASPIKSSGNYGNEWSTSAPFSWSGTALSTQRLALLPTSWLIARVFNALKATPPLLGWVSVETRLQAAYVRNGAGHEVITAPLHLGRRNLAPEGHMRLAFMCCAFQRKCSNCQPRYLAMLRVETLVWRVAKITRMGSDPAWEGVREVLVSLLDFQPLPLQSGRE